jgi:glutamate synthase (NADPH/NADH) large chain
MFLIDTAQADRRRRRDQGTLAAEQPYEDWLHSGLIHLGDLPEREREVPTHAALSLRQQSMGYTEEELAVLLKPMAVTGAEPIGSMGNDAPLAAISERPRQLFDYFSQLFAQVTNPPLDAIREELVTSLGSQLGPSRTSSMPRPRTAARSSCPNSPHQRRPRQDRPGDDGGTRLHLRHRARHVPRSRGGAGMKDPAQADLRGVSRPLRIGTADRAVPAGVTKDFAPIPSLLLTGAVHRLPRPAAHPRASGSSSSRATRAKVHHIALLVGYGATRSTPASRWRRSRTWRCAGTCRASTPRPPPRTW